VKTEILKRVCLGSDEMKMEKEELCMYGSVRNKTRRLYMQAIARAEAGLPMRHHLMACGSALAAEAIIVIGNTKVEVSGSRRRQHSQCGSSQLRTNVPYVRLAGFYKGVSWAGLPSPGGLDRQR